jgi:adenosylhomocysteine nucleosidase
VSRTLLFFAMPSEASPFLRELRRLGRTSTPTPLPSGVAGGRRYRVGDLEVWVTGVGPANAVAIGTLALEAVRPERVVTAGIGGALRPGMKVGDVVHDAEEPTGLAARLSDLGSRAGLCALSQTVVVTAAQKAALFRSTGADIVDMESGAIRELCRRRSIPSATVRSVSDQAEDDLPLDFNRVYTSTMTLSPTRLAWEILRRPTAIPGLIRLGRHAADASERLAGILAKAL